MKRNWKWIPFVILVLPGFTLASDLDSLTSSKSIGFKKFYKSLKENPQVPWTEKAREAFEPSRQEYKQYIRSEMEKNKLIESENERVRQAGIQQAVEATRKAAGPILTNEDGNQNQNSNSGTKQAEPLPATTPTGYQTYSGNSDKNSGQSTSPTFSTSGAGAASGPPAPNYGTNEKLNGSDVPKEMTFSGKPKKESAPPAQPLRVPASKIKK